MLSVDVPAAVHQGTEAQLFKGATYEKALMFGRPAPQKSQLNFGANCSLGCG